ncbi:MAG TPA: tRNA lysidine(34) synthetase TilS, partial [Thermoanaerobaculia bacterium]|nr:tRNA lysidine(34) synthetase TilS [Thermoanaerobaculia bacterium]
MRLVNHLRQFFEETAPLSAGDSLLVAFSGGPDSLALLSALTELARDAPFSLLAAHINHGADDGATERAQAATELARGLSVPIEVLHAPPGQGPRKNGEAELRTRRYEALERYRARSGARYIATAHHRQDQAETVLLRLLYGS